MANYSVQYAFAARGPDDKVRLITSRHDAVIDQVVGKDAIAAQIKAGNLVDTAADAKARDKAAAAERALLTPAKEK